MCPYCQTNRLPNSRLHPEFLRAHNDCSFRKSPFCARELKMTQRNLLADLAVVWTHALRTEKRSVNLAQQNGAERNGALVRCWRGIKWLSGPMIYTTSLFSARVRFPVKWQCIWRTYKTILFFFYTSLLRQALFSERYLAFNWHCCAKYWVKHFHCWWWSSGRYLQFDLCSPGDIF